MKNSDGVTLPEIMVTIAILGIIGLTVARVNGLMSKMTRTSQNDQIMSYDAVSLLTYITLNLKTCGDGLRGIPDITMGKTVIAPPNNVMDNALTDLIFLSKDQAPVGSLGTEDLWTRFSTGTVNNRDCLVVRRYQTDNWLDIKSGATPPVQTDYIKVQDGVHISRLWFTLFDSQNPPRIASQDPNASSTVRVDLQLTKADAHFEQERTVTLENLLYGPR